MVRSAVFHFTSPVENAILAKTHVLAVATSDVEDQLGVGTFRARAGRRVNGRGDGGVEAVAWVDAAKVNLFRQGVGSRSISLWRSNPTPDSEFTAAGASWAVAKIKTSDSVLGSKGKCPRHLGWCGTLSSLGSRESIVEGLGDVPVPLAGVGREGREFGFGSACGP
jgi:hypothetical protein